MYTLKSDESTKGDMVMVPDYQTPTELPGLHSELERPTSDILGSTLISTNLVASSNPPQLTTMTTPGSYHKCQQEKKIIRSRMNHMM
jgi:hypothetical protein